MHLQNMVLGLVSLTNLTMFLDNLIANGKYKAAIIAYDNISTGDNSFVKELATVSFGKYSIVTVDFSAPEINSIVLPFLHHYSYIEIIMVDSRDWKALIRRLEQKYIYDCTLDIIFLFEKHSEQNQQMMLKRFKNDLYDKLALLNCVVVFYRNPANGKSSFPEQRNAYLDQSVEVFVLYSSMVEVTQNIFDLSINSDSDISDEANLTNLTSSVFAMSSKNMRLVIHTYSSILWPINDTSFTIVNDADIFLSNFISNNIKNVIVSSVYMGPEDVEYSEYNTSSQRNYMELYSRSTSKKMHPNK